MRVVGANTFSEEDKKEFMKIMLDMIHEEYYISEIAEHLGISETFARKLRDTLIESSQLRDVDIKKLAERTKLEIRQLNRNKF